MKIKILSVVFLGIILSNCSNDNDDDCVRYEQASVVETNTPLTGQVNQDVVIDVFFGCYDGCGQFGSLDVEKEGNTWEIMVTAKYSGCICPLYPPILKTNFIFRTSEPGVYYLKFLKFNENYLIDTLTIF